jgi:hypothetical protein
MSEDTKARAVAHKICIPYCKFLKQATGDDHCPACDKITAAIQAYGDERFREGCAHFTEVERAPFDSFGEAGG